MIHYNGIEGSHSVAYDGESWLVIGASELYLVLMPARPGKNKVTLVRASDCVYLGKSNGPAVPR